MRKHVTRWTGVRLLAAVALVGAGMTTGVGAASAHGESKQTTVDVVMAGDDIEVQKWVDGRVLTFDVTTTTDFSILQVFAPKPGSSVAEVLASLEVQLDGGDPDSGAAAAESTRELTRNAEWFGGVDVTRDQPASFTVRLDGGTYYLIDIETGFGPENTIDVVRELKVTGDGSGKRPDADARVDMRGTGDDDAGHDDGHDHDGHDDDGHDAAGHGHEFEAPESMPARGVVEVRNQDGVIHFMSLSPVQPGTTREDIQAFIDSGFQGPDPFLPGPTASMNVLSPGERANLNYDLPPGTYVMACFIADEVDAFGGAPHAFLGMFEVVELK